MTKLKRCTVNVVAYHRIVNFLVFTQIHPGIRINRFLLLQANLIVLTLAFT